MLFAIWVFYIAFTSNPKVTQKRSINRASKKNIGTSSHLVESISYCKISQRLEGVQFTGLYLYELNEISQTREALVTDYFKSNIAAWIREFLFIYIIIMRIIVRQGG